MTAAKSLLRSPKPGPAAVTAKTPKIGLAITAARRAGIYVTMAAWQTRLRINAWPAGPNIYT